MKFAHPACIPRILALGCQWLVLGHVTLYLHISDHFSHQSHAQEPDYLISETWRKCAVSTADSRKAVLSRPGEPRLLLQSLILLFPQQPKHQCSTMRPLADLYQPILCLDWLLRTMCDDVASCSEVIQQSTGGAVRGVHRAQEAPAVREQLADCSGTEFSEVGPSMYRPTASKEVQDMCVSCPLTNGSWRFGA